MSEERTGYRNGRLIYPISIVDHKKETGGGGDVTYLDDLEDVTLSSPTSGQILKYNGSIWENKDDDGTIPAPNSVGTDQIIDGSVIEDDLNDSVKAKIQKTYDISDEALNMDFDVVP